MSDFETPIDDELGLRTARLVIRPVAEGDGDALHADCRDPEVSRMMTWTAHESLARTEQYVRTCVTERKADRDYVWVVTHEGRIGGIVALDGVVRGTARLGRAELGYWLGRAFRERGFVTEAVGAVLACGFTRLALHKVTVHAFTENAPSLRVIEKLGFTRVGLKRKDVWKDGRWHDQLAFELLADDRAAQRLIADAG